MKRTYLFAAMFCGLLGLHAAPTDSAGIRLSAFFRNLSSYDTQFSQEKVYLHLDNSAYFVGEKLWFKAYVTRASSLMPSDLSKVLYVELRNSYGGLIDRKSYELEEGQANGCFDLGDLLVSGFYEIRAYTRAMLNWDGAYTFSRVVPVYDEPKETGNYKGRLSMFNPVSGSETPSSTRPKAAVEHPADAQGKDLCAEFYPEGGWRVKGQPSVVAYKVCDRDGSGDYAVGRLYDEKGNVVQTFRPLHDGMGRFALEGGRTYSRVTFSDSQGKEREYRLPEEREEGVAMALADSSDSLEISLYATPRYRERRLGVSVMCRGAAAYFSTLTFHSGHHMLRIAHKALHDGINSVTLFTDEGEILCERLVWSKPDRAATLQVRQNQPVYSPFSPVVLDMQLLNALKKPARAYFSLSVREDNGELAAPDAGISTELLLSGDLRGYIARPDYYFEADDETHRAALDLLLCVQGWRRYEWQQMAGVKPLKVSQPIEEQQVVTGHVMTSDNHPYKGLDLNLLVTTGNGTTIAAGQSADDGSFAFLLKKFYGEGWGFITTQKNGKRASCRILLERNFSPALRPFDPRQMLVLQPTPLQPTLSQSDTFEWTDTIAKNQIRLRAVTVREKRRTDFASGLYNWGGGEEAARRNSYIYYNAEEGVMEEMDKGEEVGYVWDWLKKIDKDFDYNVSDSGDGYDFYYKNRRAKVSFDNGFAGDESGTASSTIRDINHLFLDEVRAIYIVLNGTSNDIIGGNMSENTPSASILLYSRPNDMKPIDHAKKGMRVTRFRGYEPPVTFLSPDYRRIDANNENDFRRTLYWNPDVLTDSAGHASVVLYSNARAEQHLRITACAVLPDGSLLDFSR